MASRTAPLAALFSALLLAATGCPTPSSTVVPDAGAPTDAHGEGEGEPVGEGEGEPAGEGEGEPAGEGEGEAAGEGEGEPAGEGEGEIPDAGTPDADGGEPNAGTPDAGPVDAGPVDAGPACTVDADCGGSSVCCEEECVDLQSDRANCGGCGLVIPDLDVCVGGAPVRLTFDTLCDFNDVVIVHDEFSNDVESVNDLFASITTSCGKTFNSQAVSFADPVFVDQDTRKLLGFSNHLVLTAGGPNANPVVGSSQEEWPGLAFNIEFGDGFVNGHFVNRDTGVDVKTIDLEHDVDNAHDFLALQVTRDIDNNLVVMAYGLGASGTRAAVFFAQRAFAAGELDNTAFILLEWTQKGGPDNGFADDTYVRLTGR